MLRKRREVNPLADQKGTTLKTLTKRKGIRKTASKFITYSGYIPELNLFLNEGYYFKIYLLEESAFKVLYSDESKEKSVTLDNLSGKEAREGKETFLEQALHYPGFKLQFIASKNKTYGIFGIKAELPEDAEEIFKTFEESFFCSVVSCEEWFSMMAQRLKFSSFSGIPQGKNTKKRTAIRLIQPYDVNIRQKNMEISRKTVKTMILIGYPSKLFSAFATELLELSDKLILVVFAEELDVEQCLVGVNLSQDIRSARKETMKEFLKKASKEGTKLYNTCALVTLEGLPGEVEEISQMVKTFCKKYLMVASELDYQQAEAYRSTLPLLKNHIHYHRILSERNLKALLPWSTLKECKKNVYYGEDVISGRVMYDRRIYQENGFILSSNYSWALMQVRKEIQDYLSSPVNPKEKVSILTGEMQDFSVFGEGEKKQIQLSYQDVPIWLIRAAFIRWAIHGLSTNEQVMKRYLDMILKAAEGLRDEKRDEIGNDINSLQEHFLSEMGEKERRALSVRPFITEYNFSVISTKYGMVYQVKGNGVQAELAYALLFHSLHGIVYSLNSELLACNFVETFKLHPDSLYTFLTQDNRLLYESKSFARLLKDAPFLLIGEHKIFEKLKLSERIGLNKSQREWIAEPAKGALLMTRLVTYRLKENALAEQTEGEKAENDMTYDDRDKQK